MNPLIFCTGNQEKFANAELVCKSHSIDVVQRRLEIAEIQSENAEEILQDKLAKAYDLIGQPVLVSDDSWEIPDLKGFPGPYMKSINTWFKPEDYLRLTLPLEDRSIYLVQWLGFTDGTEVKTFQLRTKGTLLREIKGEYGAANHKLVTMDGDNGKSIAEIYDQGLNRDDRAVSQNWHEFARWYKSANAR